MPIPKRILITKNEQNFEQVSQWANVNGVALTYQSFIETTPITGQKIAATDWVFFSSPSSVRHYFDNYQLQAKHIAVYGKATEKALVYYNYEANFCGPHEATPTEIGLAFKAKINPSATVLFPISQRSKQSIVKVLSPAQRVVINTYNTTLKPSIITQSFDVILFTSPSNLAGYLENNTLSKATQVVALGNTTGNELKKITDGVKILKSPSADAFISYLKELLR